MFLEVPFSVAVETGFAVAASSPCLGKAIDRGKYIATYS